MSKKEKKNAEVVEKVENTTAENEQNEIENVEQATNPDETENNENQTNSDETKPEIDEEKNEQNEIENVEGKIHVKCLMNRGSFKKDCEYTISKRIFELYNNLFEVLE